MIRASIQKDSFEKMDRRVKPGNDIQVRGAAEYLNVISQKKTPSRRSRNGVRAFKSGCRV